MGDSPIVGPIRVVDGPDGTKAPFYVVPFDKDGTCVGPRTRDLLVADAKDATDIFLFSHGWNNTWPTAVNRYEEFIAKYLEARQQVPGPPRPEYRPLLAGVFWPSAVLVGSDEQAPVIAGDVGTEDLLELTADLPADQTARLSELLTQDRLNADEALEAAKLIAPLFDRGEDEIGDTAPSAAEIVEVWRKIGAPSADSTSQEVGGRAGREADGDAQVAGWQDIFDPRQIVRSATVLMMKDRAGRVGAHGVSEMLVALRGANESAHIHLIGHSYGCRVVLSALCAPSDADAVTVDSVLLLQAATSCYCFAEAGNVPGSKQAGGYHKAPARSAKPVVCTFSSHDVPLTKLFHFAARRASDLGDPVIAGSAPSRYAALGGYGPQGVASTTVEPAAPPNEYPFATGKGIIGLHGDSVISGHGDVTSDATAWMLLSQVRD